MPFSAFYHTAVSPPVAWVDPVVGWWVDPVNRRQGGIDPVNRWSGGDGSAVERREKEYDDESYPLRWLWDALQLFP
ncbi:MAG: hypothetical protein HY709_07655 [Candidatus Latescibacteria bacterium]|nr:hypothetical protein [Candidatus Latescibacterota bacterium]